MLLPMLDMMLTASGNNPFSGSPAGALIGENGLLTNPTGAWDKFKNGNTNEVNKAIAEQNLSFQRENLDYNRALNEEIFNRADTAYQRQIADMRAAGLNPLMAQGGAETGGSATPTESLHNEYQHQDVGTLSTLQGLGDLLNTIQNYEIGFSKARESRAQADSATAQATIDKQTAMDKIASSKFDKRIKQIQFGEMWRKYDYNDYFGINDGMTEKERMMSIINRAINSGKEYTKYGFKNDEVIKHQDRNNPTEMYKDLASEILANKAVDIIGELLH